MKHHFQLLVLLSVLVAATGCSPSEPVPNTGSLSGSPESTTAEGESKSVGSTTPVDPAIDAGMMADELEHSQRLMPKATNRLNATIETNPESHD
ncbi:hypothetical protein LOC71_18940 [Rhodopirellula sp. JC740]|uniref:Secreted protein n=1 Tax=Rhodopirellula halodulae TaxID=2894198 RepID=A0ABS8NLB1_9BACT|nr:hypothetical protein [Rhodopirellula sp. JC740]MCC9644359.1 hypothetical protein [Rhodopirellula sp. JC740]